MSSALTTLTLLVTFCVFGCLCTTQGSVTVCNRGAYVAKCALESKLVDGQTRVYETGNFPVGQCTTMDLPFTSVSARFYCDNFVFIGATRNVFQESFSAPSVRCYNLGGTTFHPSWSQTC